MVAVVAAVAVVVCELDIGGFRSLLNTAPVEFVDTA
jgi:hypothetical protein